MKIPPWLPIYGDTSFRGDCPTEVAEQVALMRKIRQAWPGTIGRLALHPRNEGKRDWRTAASHKAEGMTEGASDIVIPGNPALVLELKRRDHTKSRLPKVELDYLEAAKARGAFVCVALGWESAMDAVEDWANG